VLAFERRDLGASGSLRIPGLPKALMGTGGPLRRSAAERLTTALAWGAGIGVYALIVSTSSEDLRELMTSTPSLRDVMQTAFPTLDLNDPGFALQLLFVQIGTLFIGLAAAAIVGGWASDEVDGRLELLLTTSVARARWFASTTLGAYLIIVVTSVVVALATGIGLAATGEDPLKSMTGVLVLALYGTAMAGVGVAVGGLWRPSAAGAAVAVAVVALLMIDILVPALNLPDWVGELALRSHYGEPMVGNWNPVGIVVSLALAIGGLALGAWGFSRRDLRD
jgi:ABC-2 type transport system permease protein